MDLRKCQGEIDAPKAPLSRKGWGSCRAATEGAMVHSLPGRIHLGRFVEPSRRGDPCGRPLPSPLVARWAAARAAPTRGVVRIRRTWFLPSVPAAHPLRPRFARPPPPPRNPRRGRLGCRVHKKFSILFVQSVLYCDQRAPDWAAPGKIQKKYANIYAGREAIHRTKQGPWGWGWPLGIPAHFLRKPTVPKGVYE